MTDAYERLEAQRERILEVAARWGASNVRVFGSVARGEADDRSDVDFLVDLEPERTLLDLGGLLMDLQDLLECDVDVVPSDSIRERLRQGILQEAVAL